MPGNLADQTQRPADVRRTLRLEGTRRLGVALKRVSEEDRAFERRLPDGVFEQFLEIVATDKLAQLLAAARAMPRSLLRIV